ncbi:YceD family protein [Pseudorhodoferax sp.]|uniref:YceD family protein n=1 Tax=Pseudorhodoferax sp. TaxID=1993553 RepID=UPI002DD66D51|nr:YceD family protein [Pseudorhodoferax sp.]
MKAHKQARGLDIKAFAQSAGDRAQEDQLADYPRLLQEAEGRGAERPVRWHAVGQWRTPEGVAPQVWLHLQAAADVPLTCQRCLEPVDEPLAVDRWFRFVADEAQAAREDEDAEEDVLVLDPAFDLPALVEDELLMALPLVPRHAVCPGEVRMEVVDPGFVQAEAEKPNPFGALAGLKRKSDQDDH